MTPKEALKIGRDLLNTEPNSVAHQKAEAAWQSLQKALQKAHTKTRGGKKANQASTSSFQVGDPIRMPKLGSSSLKPNAVRGSLSGKHTTKECRGKIVSLERHRLEVDWITEGPLGEKPPNNRSWVSMTKYIVKDTLAQPLVFCYDCAC